jgi:hypothetical protein
MSSQETFGDLVRDTQKKFSDINRNNQKQTVIDEWTKQKKNNP